MTAHDTCAGAKANYRYWALLNTQKVFNARVRRVRGGPVTHAAQLLASGGRAEISWWNGIDIGRYDVHALRRSMMGKLFGARNKLRDPTGASFGAVGPAQARWGYIVSRPPNSPARASQSTMMIGDRGPSLINDRRSAMYRSRMMIGHRLSHIDDGDL